MSDDRDFVVAGLGPGGTYCLAGRPAGPGAGGPHAGRVKVAEVHQQTCKGVEYSGIFASFGIRRTTCETNKNVSGKILTCFQQSCLGIT